MKRSAFLHTIACFLALQSLSRAADPTWWTSRGVVNASPANNLAPATVGQAKHMVKQALAEMLARLPAGEYSTLETEVLGIVDLTIPTDPAGFEEQRSVLLGGQLKAMAKPFYDRMRAVNPAWLNFRMYQANVRVLEPGASPHTYSPYPWSVFTGDDTNKAVATLGQLKAVFALSLETWVNPGPGNPIFPAGLVDTDGDGLSDITEMALGTNPAVVNTDDDYVFLASLPAPSVLDSDGDGLSNAEEALIGRNPAVADPVADTSTRSLDVFNLSPF